MIRMPSPHGYHLKDRRKRHKALFNLQKQHYAYARFMTGIAIGFGALVTGFCYFLLNNNYTLFENAFLIFAPEVVKGLNTELHLANLLLLGAFMTYVFMMAFLGLKISHKLIVPIYLIQEKMLAIARGDLSHSKLIIRKDDDFQEYCETFNHMAEGLKQRALKDILDLEKLRPDPKNHDAVQVWESLLEEKRAWISEASPRNETKKSA